MHQEKTKSDAEILAEVEAAGTPGISGETGINDGTPGGGISGHTGIATQRSKKHRWQKLEGPWADIADTARIMPAYMEAKWAKAEKHHALVITNQMADCDVIREDDPAVATAVKRDGNFVLIRQADKPRRAQWYRVG